MDWKRDKPPPPPGWTDGRDKTPPPLGWTEWVEEEQDIVMMRRGTRHRRKSRMEIGVPRGHTHSSSILRETMGFCVGIRTLLIAAWLL